jgi:GT2 family glycosyltransferase
VATTSPRLSVIVPVYQDVETLPACLDALAASDLQRSAWELIVVSHTAARAASVGSARFADTIVRLSDENWGAGYARNRGAELARGEYLAFVSSDVIVQHDALRRMVETFDTRDDLSAVCGIYMDDASSNDLVSSYRMLMRVREFERGVGQSDTFTARLAAIRRTTFIASGMFDEWRVDVPRTESAEFGRRILAVGGRVVVHPEIRGVHLRKWSLRDAVVEGVRDHGIPWQDEMRNADRMISPPLRWSRRVDRARVALAWCAFVAVLGASMRVTQATRWILPASLILSAALYAPIAQFFAQRRSAYFAIAVLPLYAIDLLAGGVGVAYSWVVRHTIGEPRPAPSIEAFAEVRLKTWPPVPTRSAPQPQAATTESAT